MKVKTIPTMHNMKQYKLQKPYTEQFIIHLNFYTILRLGFGGVDWCYCVHTSPLSALQYKWLLYCVMCKYSLRLCIYFKH